MQTRRFRVRENEQDTSERETLKSKRNQPPSPAVDSPSADLFKQHAAIAKKIDSRKSPAAQVAEGTRDPLDVLVSNQRSFLSAYDDNLFMIDGRVGDIADLQFDKFEDDGSADGDLLHVKEEIIHEGDEFDDYDDDEYDEDDLKGGGGRWTKDEDQKLRAAVAIVGPKNWKRISQEFLDEKRSDVQCLHRWQKVNLFNAQSGACSFRL
jgi:hypothetical protein